MIRNWFWFSALASILLTPALGAKPKYERWKYVDYAQSPACHDDCRSTTASRLYFCFGSAGMSLIGYAKNDMPGYDPLKTALHLEHFVALRYSADHIWVIFDNHNELRLKRDRVAGVLTDSRCNVTPSRTID